MKKGKITLHAQLIVQLDSGVHDCVVDNEGSTFIRMSSVAVEGGTSEPEPEKKQQPVAQKAPAPAPSPAPTTPTAPVSQEEATSDSANWTDQQMLAMDSGILLDECKALGIDPDKTEGKNTNKKLRTLILAYWQDRVADDTATAPAPSPRRGRPEPVAPSAPEGFTLVPRESWEDDLADGDTVFCKLLLEEGAPDADKMWEATVSGWKIPKGAKNAELFVVFSEDGMEDFLRDGDEVYVYQANI